MDIYTVSFFGHRLISDLRIAENRLEPIIERLISSKEYIDFLVGRDGDFDQLASSIIRRCKQRLGSSNSSHIWVLPYETADYRANSDYYLDYYDEIEICTASSEAHFKAAYQTRNRYMADRSDLILFYVEHPSGGAYNTLRYVQKTSKPYINLAQ